MTSHENKTPAQVGARRAVPPNFPKCNLRLFPHNAGDVSLPERLEGLPAELTPSSALYSAIPSPSRFLETPNYGLRRKRYQLEDRGDGAPYLEQRLIA